MSAFDLVSAWKGLRATPWSSAAAVVTLGLGIGASVAVLAVAYGVLLSPLPFPHADRLFRLQRVDPPTGLGGGLQLAEFNDWRAQLRDRGQFAGYASDAMTLRGAGTPEEVRVGVVAGDYFQTLGAAPLAGRAFADADPPETVVLSSALSARLFGRDPAASVGRTITLGARPLRVAAVMPRSFGVVAQGIDAWVSAHGVAPRTLSPTGGDFRFYQMIVRVTPGRAPEALKAQALALARRPAPGTNRTPDWDVALDPLHDVLVGDTKPALLSFTMAAGLLLLVACANVATLLVGRSIARTRESAVRLALGATRGRLVRTSFFEALLMAFAGAGVGWGIARATVQMLQHRTDTTLPRLDVVPVGASLTLAAAALAVLVAAACGVAPMLAMRAARLTASFRETTTTGSRSTRRLRGALVSLQLALAIVLLTGTGLLGRTLVGLEHVDLGLTRPGQVLALRLPLAETTRFDATGRAALVHDVLARVRTLPGVAFAGIGSNLPPSVPQIAFTIRVETNSTSESRTFDMVSATDGYLDAIGVRVVRGRLFTGDDLARNAPVAILSESAARHLAPLGDPLDKDINLPLPSASGTRVKPRVIGIIEDVRYNGLDASARGGVYVLWRQIPTSVSYLTVRTMGDPVALSSTIVSAVRAVDPTLPLELPRTLDQEVSRSLAPRATRFGLVGVFAGAAWLLAIVGLSGALIRAVAERRRELAVRAALGATPGRLVRIVIAHGLWLVGLGACVGVGAALAGSRLLRSLVAGVSVYDPWTYLAAVIAVFLMAIVAAYVPARRAAAADPVVLLRSE